MDESTKSHGENDHFAAARQVRQLQRSAYDEGQHQTLSVVSDVSSDDFVAVVVSAEVLGLPLLIFGVWPNPGTDLNERRPRL